MKKVFALFLCLACLFSLGSCAKQETGVPPTDDEESGGPGIVEVDAEKTALNYLTGEYNMAVDRVGYRPYCISVNNIAESWPQYGTSQADVILEMETEGGVTRLMCLYADTREVSLIGSVRSLRDPFIEAIYPLDPIIVHIGTSIYAEQAIRNYNIRTLDGDAKPSVIYIDKERMKQYATEHCKFTSGKLIDEAVIKYDVDIHSSASLQTYFNFAASNESVVLTGGAATSVTFSFSSAYDGDFRFDAASGKYLKYQRGVAQTDAGNENRQLSFENVLVLFADIRTIDNGLTQVDYQSGGTGYYFNNGNYEEFTWSKGAYADNFSFQKADGTDLMLNPGKTCFCLTRDSLERSLTIS